MQHGRVYIEAHKDIYDLVPDLWGEAQKVVQDSGWAPLVDSLLLTKALRDQSGIPVDVTAKGAALSAGQYSVQGNVGIEYGN